MKLIFAHDNRFVSTSHGVFSDPQFSAQLWLRYLQHFGELIVAAREDVPSVVQTTAHLSLSSTSNVSFELFPNLSTVIGQVLLLPAARQRMTTLVANADAVLARLPSEIGLLAVETARRLGKPWAVEVVGCAWDGLWNHGRWQGKAYAPIMRWRTRAAISRAPFALYVTERFLQERYPCSGVTTNCSNVEITVPVEPILRKRIARITENSNETPLVLGLIGSLQTRYKGVQTVFAAIAALSHDLPSVSFRVLGGGDPAPWRAEAERYGVGNRVRFDGTLAAGPAVWKWLDEVDIYLQPSMTEGLPRALIEAMSRGCPAIGSSCGGIPELLDSECLIRPGDARQLTDLLRRATTDRQWQQEQARRNWDRSNEYGGPILDRRRASFWEQFAGYASSK